jgi:hypothetical protein
LLQRSCLNPEALYVVLLFVVIQVNSSDNAVRIKFLYQHHFFRVKALRQLLVGNFISAIVVDNQYPVFGIKITQLNSFAIMVKPSELIIKPKLDAAQV